MTVIREDERLIAIRNRAGHDAFIVVFFFLTVLMALGLFVDMSSFFFPPAILLLPSFTGGLVYIIRLRQGGYYTSMREEVGRRPSVHRKLIWVAVGSGVFFAVFMYLGDLYVKGILSGEAVVERNHWLEIGGAVFEGVFFAFFMWFLYFRRYRPKDAPEEHD